MSTEPTANASQGRLRVVHLVLAVEPGGLENVVLNLVQYVDRSMFDPYVICLGGRGALAPRFEAISVPIESLGGKRRGLLRSVAHLAQRLRTLKPQVLHTHNMGPHYQGVLAARMARVPVVVHTKHGRNYPDSRPSVLANRLASTLTHRVIAVSEDVADVACRVEHVPKEKVIVIRNGIDLDRFSSRDPDSSLNVQRAVTVSRLNLVKDQTTMLRAARIVANLKPSFRLELVGEGPERAELEALRDELRLEDRVRFAGYQADVRSHLANSHLFVLSSISEGLSLTLLEAMAAGLPIVATDVGGNREVVVHGETGLLVPARSPERLAEAILCLLNDPALAARMGQAGRRRVEDEFDLRRVVARHEDLYRSLLEQKRR